MDSQSLDVLFLHVPKFRNHAKPIGEFSFILYPPIGLLGLADYLRQNGHSSRVVHLGVERRVTGEINLARILNEHRPAIVGLDLHWHFQSYDVIEVARQVKRVNPSLPILLGGFTASLFADEILRGYPEIDAIIRGDAELPILKFIRHHKSDRVYRSIPNLSWRDSNGTGNAGIAYPSTADRDAAGPPVIHNPITYEGDDAILNSLSFTDFTLIKDYPVFIRSFSRYTNLTGLSERLQRLLFAKFTTYPVYLGRGCRHDCSFCGGSRDAQVILSRRTSVSLRSTAAIISSIADLARFGFDFAYLPFDCFPQLTADDIYIEIFEEIKRLGLSINLEVERYSLPGLPFIEAFKSLSKNSFVSLTVHTNNEELRTANGLYRYSNAALEECLRMLDDNGVKALLCFTCGLPYETREDLESMVGYRRSLRRRFKGLRFNTSMIEIEPASRMSRYPQVYGLSLDRTTFADYYRYHGQPDRNHWHEMGYTRRECPGHDEVTRFFCRHFCKRFGDHWTSPYICNVLTALQELGALRIIDKVLAAVGRKA